MATTPSCKRKPQRNEIPENANERLAYLVRHRPFCPTEEEIVRTVLALDGVSQEAYQEENPRANSLSTFRGSMQMLKEDMCSIKSSLPGGTYTYVWEKYRTFICDLRTKYGADTASLDQTAAGDNIPIIPEGVVPFTGTSLKDSIPLVNFQLGEAFMEREKEDAVRAGAAAMTNRVKAMNVLLQYTKALRMYVYGGSKIIDENKLSYSTGRSGQAVRKGKDRSSEYKMARTLAPDGSGKKTRQEDPLRGNVHEPLKSTEIKQMYDYLRRGIRAPTSTSNRPLTSPYERARDAVMLGMTTVGISRGDDVRHPEVSAGHCGMLPLPKYAAHVVSGGGKVFFILKDFGKNYRNRILYCGFVRGPDPFTCLANCLGQYFILSWGRNGKRKFPDIFNADCNWTKETPFMTDASGEHPWFYDHKDAQRIGVRLNTSTSEDVPALLPSERNSTEYPEEMRQSGILDEVNMDGHADVMKRLFEEAGCTRFREDLKITHLKTYAAMRASYFGALPGELQLQGRWMSTGVGSSGSSGETSSEVMLAHYLRNLCIAAMICLGGYPDKAYNNSRDAVVDIGDLEAIRKFKELFVLLEYIFPECWARAKRAEAAYNKVYGTDAGAKPTDPCSVSNFYYTGIMVATAVIWLVDAVLILEKMSDLGQDIPFSYLLEEEVKPEWERFQVIVKAVVKEHKDIDLSHQLELRDLHRHVSNERAIVVREIMASIPDLFEKLVDELLRHDSHRRLASEARERQHAIDNAIREIAFESGIAEDLIRNLIATASAQMSNTGSDDFVQPPAGAPDLQQPNATEQRNDLELPYILKRPSAMDKTQIASSIVDEWTNEVIPRLQKYGVDVRWWKEGDRAQANMRQKAKSLYDALNKRVSDGVDTNVCSAASKLDDIVESELVPKKRSSCKADIYDIIEKVKSGGCDICNEDSIKECIRKRKRRRAEMYNENKK